MHEIGLEGGEEQDWFERTADEDAVILAPVVKTGAGARVWLLPSLVCLVVFLITAILGGCATRKFFGKKMVAASLKTATSLASTVHHPVLWVPPKNELPLVEPAPAATPSTSAQPRAEVSKSAAKPTVAVRFKADTNI
jgi:hypothetical protein